MEWLNLIGNKFGDEGATAISKCIQNIEHLDIIRCGITSRGIATLQESIRNLSTPVSIKANYSFNIEICCNYIAPFISKELNSLLITFHSKYKILLWRA